MCNFWSCVVTKDGAVFCDEMSDSHENAIAVMKKERPGISDKTADASKMQFARVEITPPAGDVFSPAKAWTLRVDESIIPAWFSDVHEKAARTALAKYIKEHIFTDTNDITIMNSRVWLKNSSAELWGSSSAVLWGSSSAVLWGSSSAELRGSYRAECFSDKSKYDISKGSNGLVILRQKKTIEIVHASDVTVKLIKQKSK